jgi:oligosaccharyltransferase complex subunit beta
MFLLQGLLWLAALVLTGVRARSSTGNNLLVVVEPEHQDQYSLFFQGLKDKDYELTFRSPKAAEPSLVKFDVPSFSHVIILAPETKNFATDLSAQALVDAVSRGVNLLVALPNKQSTISTLASEFSLILPPPSTTLISYFPERQDAPTVIPVDPPKKHPVLTNGLNPVWFTGTPHALGNSPFLVPILHAPPQSFASELDGSGDSLVEAAEKGGEGLWAGGQLGIVTGFQALNDARVTFAGGAELFSDAFIQKEISPGIKSGNEQFTKDLVAWTFQESLVFRIDSIEHQRVGATASSDKYTVNDNIVFTAYISKYDPQMAKWVPHSDLYDLQLEFTMLDPHIRTALLPVPGSPGKYSVTFRAPDRHGVFKFVINHRRKGMTFLQSSTTVAVVPPRHDEYPRFISAAWPYYIGAMSTSVGFLLFSAMWLGGEGGEKKGKTE